MESHKRLHIAMLGHKRVPSREGGIEVVVTELSTRMAALGHSVTCYNRGGHHISGAEFDCEKCGEYKGVRLKSVCTVNRRGLAALTSSFFANLYAAFGSYDVVHVHAEGPCAMMWLPRLFGKRCIATIHGLDWAREKWNGGLASKYIKLGEWVAVKCAHEIIVLSQSEHDYFWKTYRRETNLIPNGVSRPVYKKTDRITERWGLKKDSYFLFVGRLVPEKGLCDLLDAFSKVRTDKRLVIAGGNSDSNDFAVKMQRLATDDSRVVFTGFVQGEELDELYSNAYAYVLPSHLEGMPLTLLEAMSFGNCCVVSDIDACTEVTGSHALVFPKGDVSALTEKLQLCCDNPVQVEELRCGTADYICHRFNWDDITQRTLALYRGEFDK